MDTITTRDEIKQAHVSDILEGKIAVAVRKFFSEVSYVDAHIGEVRKSILRGEDDYVVCGHIEQTGSAGSQIMASVKTTTISIGDKFKTVNGMNVVQLLNKHTDFTCNNETRQAIQNIKDVNGNKKLIMTFKIGTCFRVKSEDGKEYKCYLDQIRWKLSQKTFKLEPKLHFETHGLSPRSFSMDMSTYCEQFRLDTLTQWSPVETKGVIKISDNGIIRTIAFTDGRQTVAIDNQWVYMQDISGRLEVIGEWEQQSMKIYNSEIVPNAILGKIDNLTELLGSHRKYISPLFMTDINIVEV